MTFKKHEKKNAVPPVKRELFEKWLPIFQKGEEAKKRLAEYAAYEGNNASLNSDDNNICTSRSEHNSSNDTVENDKNNAGNSNDKIELSRAEKIELNHAVTEGEKAFEIMLKPIMKVCKKIIKKEVDKPRSFQVIIDSESLKNAAQEGVLIALRKLDLSKMKNSNINLIMQYVTAKVSREALKQESSVGISPSKLRLYKKIAAVRDVIRKKNGVEPSDEEVLEYFKSGQADFHSMNGRVGSNFQPFKENQKIKLKDIIEQHNIDKGHPFKFPVTDTAEIDSEIRIENNELDNKITQQDEAEQFWRAYMDYIGVSLKDQNVIARDLRLFELPAAEIRKIPSAEFDDRMCNDFMKLIQNRKGKIREFSQEYLVNHGDGFWHVFAENEITSNNSKYLNLKYLKLSNGGVTPDVKKL